MHFQSSFLFQTVGISGPPISIDDVLPSILARESVHEEARYGRDAGSQIIHQAHTNPIRRIHLRRLKERWPSEQKHPNHIVRILRTHDSEPEESETCEEAGGKHLKTFTAITKSKNWCRWALKQEARSLGSEETRRGEEGRSGMSRV